MNEVDTIVKDQLLIQITDLHIFNNPEDQFAEVNTQQSLEQVLELIKHYPEPIDCLLATGDLVQDPHPQAYQNLLEILKSCDQDIYCLPGNHDDADLMRAHLNQANVHYDQSLKLGAWSIYFLNSAQPNSPSGFLAEDELRALDLWLAETLDQHVIICLHHHPVSIDSPWMDKMMLENAEDLFAILDRYKQIKAVIWGHIHQQFEQQRQQVQLLGTPSTCAQFPVQANEFQLDSEKPGFRWLRLAANGELQTGIKRLP